MIGKRMTGPQRALYGVLRARGAVLLTPENARVLHALKRQGRARFGVDPLGRRVAWPGLNRLQRLALRREDAHIIAAFEAYEALPMVRGEDALPAGKGRGRRVKLGESRYKLLVHGGFIPAIGV